MLSSGRVSAQQQQQHNVDIPFFWNKEKSNSGRKVSTVYLLVRTVFETYSTASSRLSDAPKRNVRSGGALGAALRSRQAQHERPRRSCTLAPVYGGPSSIIRDPLEGNVFYFRTKRAKSPRWSERNAPRDLR